MNLINITGGSSCFKNTALKMARCSKIQISQLCFFLNLLLIIKTFNSVLWQETCVSYFWCIVNGFHIFFRILKHQIYCHLFYSTSDLSLVCIFLLLIFFIILIFFLFLQINHVQSSLNLQNYSVQYIFITLQKKTHFLLLISY